MDNKYQKHEIALSHCKYGNISKISLILPRNGEKMVKKELISSSWECKISSTTWKSQLEKDVRLKMCVLRHPGILFFGIIPLRTSCTCLPEDMCKNVHCSMIIARSGIHFQQQINVQIWYILTTEDYTGLNMEEQDIMTWIG